MIAGPHLTPEGISAAAEGLLSDADQQAAEAHLANCDRCQAAHGELVGLRAVLRQANSEPPRMPDAIAHRLHSALAAESAERSRQTGVVSLGKARRSKHAAEPSKARRRLVPALAAAAGVAAIAVGGTIGYQELMDGGPQEQSASDSPQLTQENGNPAGGDAKNGNRGDSQAPETDEGYEVAGAPTLTTDGFASEVREVLQPASSPAPKKPAEPRTNNEEGIQPMSTPQNRCAETAAKDAGAKDILDVATVTFDGRSALLAIARSAKAGAVDAYVVTGCPDSGTVAHQDTVAVDR